MDRETQWKQCEDESYTDDFLREKLHTACTIKATQTKAHSTASIQKQQVQTTGDHSFVGSHGFARLKQLINTPIPTRTRRVLHVGCRTQTRSVKIVQVTQKVKSCLAYATYFLGWGVTVSALPDWLVACRFDPEAVLRASSNGHSYPRADLWYSLSCFGA